MAIINSIYPTPDEFLIDTNHIYPPGNTQIFEEYFYKKYLSETQKIKRCYLPIQWTSYYISKDYGKKSLHDLQLFIDLLPKSIQYFTISQWDDGILNNLSDLNIFNFSSGGVGSYPIPLINKPFKVQNNYKEIFCSFMGAIFGRHKIREQIYECYSKDDLFYISEKETHENFTYIMSRSLFSLCPRGYGKTSFRINEALSMGSIPVYIYDEPWIPFFDLVDFNNYGILIKENDIPNLKDILLSLSEQKIKNLQKNGSIIYNDFYSYQGCYNNIIKKLKL
jgi:hypothetical protein